MTPTVSIIIAMRNAEAFLRPCLDSLLCQTLRDFELICVNDGSTDDSAKILQVYAAMDSRIRVLNQSPQGAAAARNFGFSHAAGTYLSFLDADDFFEPDFLEEAVSRLEAHQADLCLVNARLFNQADGTERDTLDVLDLGCLPLRQPIHPLDFGDCLFQFTNSNAWSKIVRRDLVIANHLRFQDLPNTNDLYFAYMCLALAETIVYSPRKLIHYRINMKSSIQGSSGNVPTAFIQALEALKEGLSAVNLFTHYRKSYEEAVRRCCTYYLRRINTDQLPIEKRREIMNRLGLSQIDTILPEEPAPIPKDKSRITAFIAARAFMIQQKGWRYAFKWDLWKVLERLDPRGKM